MTLLIAGILGPYISKSFLTDLAKSIMTRVEKESRILKNKNYKSQEV